MATGMVIDLAFVLVAATIAGLAGPKVERWWFGRNARQLASRHARGSDAYFEELRALEATAAHAPAVRRGFRWYFVRTFVLLCLFEAAQLAISSLLNI